MNSPGCTPSASNVVVKIWFLCFLGPTRVGQSFSPFFILIFSQLLRNYG